ncbi:gamma carbonic anhydrase family protein [Propionicicella superfundia]|uniref:gamma carbonic anhydrase family protein n=1 Tax=Propionicicella superfundia TaxID=348582 RepID=UPI000417F478|nr:gamma carbonic anhydrase family protein [Propionicicella superfundia]
MLLALDEGRTPRVHPGAWIAPTADVIGWVDVGDRVSVWYQTVVRGDREKITIGAGSNLQDGTVVHADPAFPTTLGENVTVGHRAVIHGCTIGANTLIGMGAVIMNGAVIGEQCLVGAGALIPQGMVVPPRSLVLGAPAKVKRELTETEIEAAFANGQRYQALYPEHRRVTGEAQELGAFVTGFGEE